MPEKEQILESLEPLFKEAEDKKLWFFGDYQCMWFSPKELRQKHEEGRYIWGVQNWKLRSPIEKLDSLKKIAANATASVKRFESELIEGGYL